MNSMKKILFVLLSLVCMILPVKAELIVGSVAMSDRVPEEFFGTWKVVSVCTHSTNKEYFGSKSLDLWTLSRMGDVIRLANPMSGAVADVSVSDVKGQTVKFEKKVYYPDEESIETPILTLQDDKFSGIDKIIIRTFKDGKLIKEDYVEYKVKGTKLSGMNALAIFNK